MYSREEFEQMRTTKAAEMAANKPLQKQGLELLTEADKYNWIHQTNWMGEPILQLPQDMFAMQEMIFRTRPDVIVEVGVAWAGSLLFYATLLKAMGYGGRIVGVDVYIPDDLRARIRKFEMFEGMIDLVLGSSIERETFEAVKKKVGPAKNVLVVLDSNHTHEHVLAELEMYSPLVTKGNYLVCGDTIVEYIPPQTHRPRPWGPGNNPKTALDEFLKRNDRFSVDPEVENKLLLTCNPNGYLRAVK